jgi:hypothetical protein
MIRGAAAFFDDLGNYTIPQNVDNAEEAAKEAGSSIGKSVTALGGGSRWIFSTTCS